jgi:hypothetical protein
MRNKMVVDDQMRLVVMLKTNEVEFIQVEVDP